MTSRIHDKSRYTDVPNDPLDRRPSPIDGWENQPIVSLLESIRSISNLFDGIDDYANAALLNCQYPSDGLTQNESAALHLYTMQFYTGHSLYHLLNQTLRTENRDELIPWLPFLKLFLTALDKLPALNEKVWRGVRGVNLSANYPRGTRFPWWSVSSCTMDIQILNSKKFLGKRGPRTLFSIDCINGKSIANHSFFKREQEVLLMPGSYFEVMGILDENGNNFDIIQLKEIPAPSVRIPPSIIELQNTDAPLLVQKPHSIRQFVKSTLWKVNSLNSSNPNSTIPLNIHWKQEGVIVAGGNGQGNQLNQLCLPEGIFVDDNQTIYITDTGNNRIIAWKLNENNGEILAGDQTINSLNCPTGIVMDKRTRWLIIADHDNRRVIRCSSENFTEEEILIPNVNCCGIAIDKDGAIYISDREKHQVRRWRRGEKLGVVVAGGNGQGRQLNQLNWPTFLFIDDSYSIYIADCWNHRIVKWFKDAKQGILVAGGHGQGNRLKQFSYPNGIFVDHIGLIYIADTGNHRIMCWHEGAKEGTILINGNTDEESISKLKGPTSLTFDRQGNLYVTDQWNHQILKFEIDENTIINTSL